MADPKACPFCGKEAIIMHEGEAGVFVGCPDGRCPGYPVAGWENDQDKAIEVWNTRHENPEVARALRVLAAAEVFSWGVIAKDPRCSPEAQAVARAIAAALAREGE